MAYAAWLSIYGSERQRDLAAEFISYILDRARKEGEDVRKKAEEVVEEGKARSSLKLEGFERKVEVGGKEYVVKVIGGGAVEEDRGGRKLLRIKITAEVDGVKNDYEVAFGRHGKDNVTAGYAVARADAPGGREADAERLSALIKALTGREPRVYRKSDGTIVIIMLRETSEGLHALRRARRRHREVAQGVER
jgi:hypothetical protein